MRGFVFFLLAVIGLDLVLGLSLERVYRRVTVDARVGLINSALQQDPDLLVLGSSRAAHHVVPSILRARLSVSVFNAGIDGHDFLYAAMLLDLWSRSHWPPKMIALHVDPQSFSYSEVELQRAIVFAPYFHRSEAVDRILLMRGKYERLKYLSSAYRFNGKVIPMLRSLGVSADPSFDGYVGLEGITDPVDPLRTTAPTAPEAQWDLKLAYLTNIVQYCRANNVRLFLFTSPYFASNPAQAVWATQMAQLTAGYQGIDFLDLSERTHANLFAGRRSLFSDGSHLNAAGAELFSTLLANEIAVRVGDEAGGRN